MADVDDYNAEEPEDDEEEPPDHDQGPGPGPPRQPAHPPPQRVLLKAAAAADRTPHPHVWDDSEEPDNPEDPWRYHWSRWQDQ
eukprot:3421169-Alexandrium_andersonii.AAC.1